jgi:hypothetical protein
MKLMTSAEATTSNAPSANGKCCASATWKRAPAAVGVRSAASICAGAGSMASTLAGAQRCSSACARMPVPQPTSSHASPARGCSQSRNTGAAARLQRPMKRS